MLLACAGDLPNQVKMLRNGVGSVGDDMMLQHREHFHLQRDLPTSGATSERPRFSKSRSLSASTLRELQKLCIIVTCG